MTPCPQCGSPADLGLVRVYCTNRACVHADTAAKAPEPQAYSAAARYSITKRGMRDVRIVDHLSGFVFEIWHDTDDEIARGTGEFPMHNLAPDPYAGSDLHRAVCDALGVAMACAVPDSGMSWPFHSRLALADEITALFDAEISTEILRALFRACKP